MLKVNDVKQVVEVRTFSSEVGKKTSNDKILPVTTLAKEDFLENNNKLQC